MKRSKFTEQQIAFALKKAELGTSVEEVCGKLSISDATQLAWLLPLHDAGYGGAGLASGLHRTERAGIA